MPPPHFYLYFFIIKPQHKTAGRIDNKLEPGTTTTIILIILIFITQFGKNIVKMS